jgi:hypothetical protein
MGSGPARPSIIHGVCPMKRQDRTERVGKKEENEDFGIAESLGRSRVPQAETGAVTPRFSTSSLARASALLHDPELESFFPWHADMRWNRLIV